MANKIIIIFLFILRTHTLALLQLLCRVCDHFGIPADRPGFQRGKPVVFVFDLHFDLLGIVLASEDALLFI